MVDSAKERKERVNITNEFMSALREECAAVAAEPDRWRLYEARAQAKDIECAPTAVQDEACVLVLRTANHALWLERKAPLDFTAAADVTAEGFVVKQQMNGTSREAPLHVAPHASAWSLNIGAQRERSRSDCLMLQGEAISKPHRCMSVAARAHQCRPSLAGSAQAAYMTDAQSSKRSLKTL